MANKRVYRKLQRSAADIAGEKKIRAKFQKERPTLDQLVAGGDYTEPVTQAEYWDVRRIALMLREMRERQGLSLADLSALTGMDRAAISRLENGVCDNPTLSTLTRYAKGIGKRIVVKVVDIPR